LARQPPRVFDGTTPSERPPERRYWWLSSSWICSSATTIASARGHFEVGRDLDSVAVSNDQQPARGEDEIGAGPADAELTGDPVALDHELVFVCQGHCEVVAEQVDEGLLDGRHDLVALLDLERLVNMGERLVDLVLLVAGCVAYAAQNPTTLTDPSGRMLVETGVDEGSTLPRVGPFAIQRSWHPGEAAACPRLEGNG
jgi:hypothetical protein